MSSATGMVIDGIASTPDIDSSGEVLDLKGADITDLIEGRGLFSYEHKGAGKATDGEDEAFGQEIVGRILGAKKIQKESDCENERHKFFWEKARGPYLYIIGRLFDGAGHTGAQAIAAAIRDAVANNEPLVISYSVEGSTLKKEGNRLLETIVRRVAITWRPCLKTTEMGLVQDPNAPEGFGKNPGGRMDVASLVEKDEVDPKYARLGGHSMEYGPEMLKAISAGSYNVAPGALTGGAALQREDLGRQYRARAMAAYNNWNRVDDFRKFIKATLPDVSSEFLDHFADIVDQHIFKVKKAQEVITDLVKAGKGLKSPKKTAAVVPSELTVQGKPVPMPPAGSKGTSFNPDSGELTTRQGVFKASTPSEPHPHLAADLATKGINSADEFQKELQSSRGAWKGAMKNWFNVNKGFTEGKVHPGLVAHTVAFAMLSPGVPVPMQEHMYGHLVDAMRSQGVDHPTADRWQALKADWMARNRVGLPEHSRQHFLGLEGFLRTKAGPIQGFNKPEKFSEYFGDYLKDHHNDIVNVINQSGGDAHPLVRRLNEVRGVAPKLARYISGMLGAGNIVVPDTHFLRHYFGTRPDLQGSRSGSSPDNETQNHLKEAVLGATNANDNLEAMDKHYFNKHDAVKAVLNDPEIGSYFKGREEQATFPAFWWHWIAAPGHEARIGTPGAHAFNAGTDHAPFWDVANRYLQKSEEHNPDLHWHTAMQHHRWVEQYGAKDALALYYQHLVPKLQANDALRPEYAIRKTEELQVEILSLLKAAGTTKDEHPGMPSRKTPEEKLAVEWAGKKVIPGRGELVRGRGKGARVHEPVHILEANPKEFIAVHSSKLGSHGPEDLVRFPRNHPDISVRTYPKVLGESTVVGPSHHVGEFNTHPDVKKLAEGFDFAHQEGPGGRGFSADRSWWGRHPSGQKAYIKAAESPINTRLERPEDFISEPRQEGVYSNLARDFFGLGKYVPTVAVVRHPQTGQEHAIVQHAPGQEWWSGHGPHQATLEGLKNSGELDKLSFMNLIMGNPDRHAGNYLVDPDSNKINLIDHNIVLRNVGGGQVPEYLENPGLDKTPIHPESLKWLQSLSSDTLKSHLQKHEVPPRLIENAIHRLQALQDNANPQSTQVDLWNNVGRIARARQDGVQWMP